MLWTSRILVLLPALAYQLSGHSGVSALDLSARQATAQDAQPSCVQGCLDTLQSTNNCQAHDVCFCNEQDVTSAYQICLTSQCDTPADQLSGQRFQAETCGDPVRNQGDTIRAVTWAFFALAVIFVSIRLVSRWKGLSGSGFRWDDAIIIFCFALVVPLDVGGELEVQKGLGRDMYTLSISNIRDILQWFFAGEILYISIIMLTKVAIVLLYLRIWTSDAITRNHRVACWALIAILVTTMLAFDFVVIFQCDPISYAWSWIQGAPGFCIQIEPTLWAFGALDIIYNITIFFLPIYSLLKLQMAWQKKVAVCTIFVLGFVVTICAIVRLQYLVRSDARKNVTWDFHYVAIWGILEANISIICACMPAAAGFIQRWMSGDVREPLDDDWLHGSAGPQRIRIRGHEVTATEMVHNDLGGMEDAQGGQGTSKAESLMSNKAGDNLSSAASERNFLDRGKGPMNVSQPQDPTALTYRPASSGPARVEISHEPPTQPAEAKLSYRDENDIFHEVIVMDIPHGRNGPMHSRSRIRASNLRALAEDDIGGERFTEGMRNSHDTSERSSDPPGHGVDIPQSPKQSPVGSRSVSPPDSRITNSIDGGVASGSWSRPISYSQVRTSQIARTPSLASATWEAAAVAAKTPSPPSSGSPPASLPARSPRRSNSMATQTDDTDLSSSSPPPSAKFWPPQHADTTEAASKEVVFSPRSLSPRDSHYLSLKVPSAATQTDESSPSPPPPGLREKTSSIDPGVQVSPACEPVATTSRWEWPSDRADVESFRGRSPPPDTEHPSSVDASIQAGPPASSPQRPTSQGTSPMRSHIFRSIDRASGPAPDQYMGERIAPFEQSNDRARSPSSSLQPPTSSDVPLTSTDAPTTGEFEDVKFIGRGIDIGRGRSPPKDAPAFSPPRSASSQALRHPLMISAGNQTDDEEEFTDNPRTLSPSQGRDAIPSLSPTVSQIDVPAASSNLEAENRNHQSRSPLPKYETESRPLSGELLPATTYNPNASKATDLRSSSPQNDWRDKYPHLEEDIQDAFGPGNKEWNDSKEFNPSNDWNDSKEFIPMRDQFENRTSNHRSGQTYGERQWEEFTRSKNREYGDDYEDNRNWNNSDEYVNKGGWRNQSPPRFLSPLPKPNYDNMKNAGPRTASSQAVPIMAYNAQISPPWSPARSPGMSPTRAWSPPRERSISPTAWQAGVPPPLPKEERYQIFNDREYSPFQGEGYYGVYRPPSPTTMQSGVPPEGHGPQYADAATTPMRGINEAPHDYDTAFPDYLGKSPGDSRPTSQELPIRPSLSPLQPMARLSPPDTLNNTLNTLASEHMDRGRRGSREEDDIAVGESPPAAANRTASVESATQTDSDWEDHLPLAEVMVPIENKNDDERGRSGSRDNEKRKSPSPDNRSRSVESANQTDSDWEEHLDKAPQTQSLFFAHDAKPEQTKDENVNSRSRSHSPYPLLPHGYEMDNDGRGRSVPAHREDSRQPSGEVVRLPSIDPSVFDDEYGRPFPRRQIGDEDDGYEGDREGTPAGYHAVMSRSPPRPRSPPDDYEWQAGNRARSEEREWHPPNPETFDIEIPRIPAELLAQLVDGSSTKLFEEPYRSPSPSLGQQEPSFSSRALPLHDADIREFIVEQPSRPRSPDSREESVERDRSPERSPQRENTGLDWPSNPHSPEPYYAQLAALSLMSDGEMPSPSMTSPRSASPLPSPKIASTLAHSLRPSWEEGNRSEGYTPGSENGLPNWSATPWQPPSPGIEKAESEPESPNEQSGVSIQRGDSYRGDEHQMTSELSTPGSEFVPTRPISQMNAPTIAAALAAAEHTHFDALSPPRSPDISPERASKNENDDMPRLSRRETMQENAMPVELLGSDGPACPRGLMDDAKIKQLLRDLSRSPSRSPEREQSPPRDDYELPMSPSLFEQASREDLREPSPLPAPREMDDAMQSGISSPVPPTTEDVMQSGIASPIANEMDTIHEILAVEGLNKDEADVEVESHEPVMKQMPTSTADASVGPSEPPTPMEAEDTSHAADGTDEFGMEPPSGMADGPVWLMEPETRAEEVQAENVQPVSFMPDANDAISPTVEDSPDSTDVPKRDVAVDALWSQPPSAELESGNRRSIFSSTGSVERHTSVSTASTSDSLGSDALPPLTSTKSSGTSPTKSPGTPEPEQELSRPDSQLNGPTLKQFTVNGRTPEAEIKELDLPKTVIESEDAEARTAEDEARPDSMASMYYSPLVSPGNSKVRSSTSLFMSAIASPIAEIDGTYSEVNSGSATPKEETATKHRSASPATAWLSSV